MQAQAIRQWPTFLKFLDEARESTVQHRRDMVRALLNQHVFPWIEDDLATFVSIQPGAERVAVNLDSIDEDPPFMPMVRLDGTDMWYLQRQFSSDELLDYLIVVDDPMTPLSTETDILSRIQNFWQTDSLNPSSIRTAQLETSVLRMPDARPFPDWQAMTDVPRGQVFEHLFDSASLNFTDRKLWVYTPPGYDRNGSQSYPLLIMLDGQWMNGPLQVPYIADALIKHNQMEPVVIAMKQSAGQSGRGRDYVSNDDHLSALTDELIPMLQQEYRINTTDVGIAGAGVGAIASAHAALRSPFTFTRLGMMSPPLGAGSFEEQLRQYYERFQMNPTLPKRIFQSVGAYEQYERFYKPGLQLSELLTRRAGEKDNVDYQFVEIGSGHSLLAFRSVAPELLHHLYRR